MEGQIRWALPAGLGERRSNLRGRGDRRTALQVPSLVLSFPSPIILGSSVQGQATSQVSSVQLGPPPHPLAEQHSTRQSRGAGG